MQIGAALRARQPVLPVDREALAGSLFSDSPPVRVRSRVSPSASTARIASMERVVCVGVE